MSTIGVDFGGTRIKAGLVSGGAIEKSESVDTHAGAEPPAILDAIASLVKKVAPSPQSVGMAIPGECDGAGRVYRLPNVPGFEGVAIAAELEKRLSCPVTIENDATTAALGEMVYGHGRNHKSFAMVTLGTGIGGGIVIDRRLRRGKQGFGGELGHIPIDRSENAPKCACGLTGCVEAFTSSQALLDRARALGVAVTEIKPLADAAHAGNANARKVFDEMGVSLGFMITAIQNTLDLDAIVFSGGVALSFDLIEPALRRQLRARQYAPPLAEVPLLVSELGDRAGLVGAAHLPEMARGELS